MSQDEASEQNGNAKKSAAASVGRAAIHSPPRSKGFEVAESVCENGSTIPNGLSRPNYSPNSLLKSASISASKCVAANRQYCEVRVPRFFSMFGTSQFS